MVVEDEYELLPHEEIQRLRNELDGLKKNPLGETPAAKNLYSAVADLTLAINGLTKLLTSTNDEMAKEFEKTSITEQFSKISDQNEQIAQGILSVAQLVEKFQASPQPVSPPIQPQVQNPQPVAPEPSIEPTSQPSPSILPSQDPLMAPSNMVPPVEPAQSMASPPSSLNSSSVDNSQPSAIPSMTPPPSMPTANSLPPPGLDLPPAPTKKKGIMGLFK